VTSTHLGNTQTLHTLATYRRLRPYHGNSDNTRKVTFQFQPTQFASLCFNGFPFAVFFSPVDLFLFCGIRRSGKAFLPCQLPGSQPASTAAICDLPLA
jgi:hypothetical protein